MSSSDQKLKADLRLHPHDHRELNKKFHFFHIDEKIGAGLPLWLPAGVILRDEIEKLAKELEFIDGYQRVVSPHIAKEELYQQSGHLAYYQESMFPAMELENARYRLRPMCCPHHHQIYATGAYSYRDLPVKLAEYGQVYRYELSGVLSGLMRARGLAQNDAHLYVRKDQVKGEIRGVLEMYEKAFKILGISDYRLRLSKGPSQSESKSASGSAKYVAEPEQWQWAEGLLREALQDLAWPFDEAADEAAFYGPKIDIQLKNVYGREESASSVQLDFVSAERFNLAFINQAGEKERPYIIHRAPLGSHERLVSFLIEHHKAAFPFWLSPVQVKVLPIADRHHAFADSVFKVLHNSFLRVEVDKRAESLSKKIAEAQAQLVPVVIVIGDQELAEQKLSVRFRGSRKSESWELEKLRLRLRERYERREV